MSAVALSKSQSFQTYLHMEHKNHERVSSVTYYVRPKRWQGLEKWWKSRRFKRISSPGWEKLTENDNIEEILKTHRYRYDFYPDNDSFHRVILFFVDIKKVTITTEFV